MPDVGKPSEALQTSKRSGSSFCYKLYVTSSQSQFHQERRSSISGRSFQLPKKRISSLVAEATTWQTTALLYFIFHCIYSQTDNISKISLPRNMIFRLLNIMQYNCLRCDEWTRYNAGICSRQTSLTIVFVRGTESSGSSLPLLKSSSSD